MPLKADLKKLTAISGRKTEQQLIAYQKEIVNQYKIALIKMKAELASYYEQNLSTQRLTGLIESIEQILNEAGINGINITAKGISKSANFNYDSNLKNLEATLGVKLSFAVLEPNILNSLVANNKFSKISWQAKGIDNINSATRTIKNNIFQGVIQGKNYEVVAKQITRQMNIAVSDALRIVKTEVHRASNEARIMSMKKSQTAAQQLGYTSVKVWNGGESFPRNHDSMNGISVSIDDQFTLPSGFSTDGPSLSGNPGDDVNCGCYLTFELLELQGV